MLQRTDDLPQLIGDYKPLDQWQVHLNRLFYGLRGDKLRSYYQTFGSADYRLAHALAADYYERVVKREKGAKSGKSSCPTAKRWRKLCGAGWKFCTASYRLLRADF